MKESSQINAVFCNHLVYGMINVEDYHCFEIMSIGFLSRRQGNWIQLGSRAETKKIGILIKFLSCIRQAQSPRGISDT